MKRPSKTITPAHPDLTDRSLAEQSLINSELRYRRVFETIQDRILTLDAQTGAVTDVNPRLIDLLGYSREEFIAMKLWHVGAFKDTQASKGAFEVQSATQSEGRAADSGPVRQHIYLVEGKGAGA